MSRTEGQWKKGIGLITPSEDVPVLLLNSYLNFGGVTVGEDGYGFRDNAGNIQFKNSGGSWANLGSGGGSSTWGGITGTLSDQTDLQDALDDKADISSLGAVATSNDYNDLDNLPDLSVFDEVEQYANLAAFPVTGNSAKFYLAQDTGIMYRWTGAAYDVISASLALGETSSTAYRGDRGKTAYDHSQLTTGNPHNVTKSDVGLGSVDNTSDANKPVSTATQTALNAKQDTLVSGTNIKTVNGNSLLGSGNLVIAGGSGVSEELAIAYAFCL